MIRVSSVPLRVKQVPEDFTAFVAELTGWTNIKSVTIVKKSVDARKKTNLHLEYSFDVEINGDEEEALKNSLYRNVGILQPYPVYQSSRRSSLVTCSSRSSRRSGSRRGEAMYI